MRLKGYVMPNSKFDYKFVFNDSCSDRGAFCYDYRNTKNIKMAVTKAGAVVSFSMMTKKTVDDLISPLSGLFADAYRKLHLIYACKYGVGLRVKKIVIIAADEKRELDSENTVGFPLVYSMISTKSFDLADGFTRPEIVKSLLTVTKSSCRKKDEFIALYSYLQSKNREFEIDRFTNLWTSMNATYRYYGRDRRINNDKGQIDNMIKVLGYDCHIADRSTADKNRKLFYDVHELLSGIPRDNRRVVYDFIKSGEDISIADDLNRINDIAGSFNEDLYPFLLFDVPYRLRCDYLHGNRCTTLISNYYDYEIRCLETLNYFLDRFLDEQIPKMFIGTAGRNND